MVRPSLPRERGEQQKGNETMINEAKTQPEKVVTPAELATCLPPISADKTFLAASHATTNYWTGNWNDTDSVED